MQGLLLVAGHDAMNATAKVPRGIILINYQTSAEKLSMT